MGTSFKYAEHKTSIFELLQVLKYSIASCALVKYFYLYSNFVSGILFLVASEAHMNN